MAGAPVNAPLSVSGGLQTAAVMEGYNTAHEMLIGGRSLSVEEKSVARTAILFLFVGPPDCHCSCRKILYPYDRDRIVTRIPVKTVPVDDVMLAYREYGSGYPVIFISGLGATTEMWNPPVIEKISRHFRVILFDNRGMGYSSGSDKTLSIPLLARDTAMLMDALGIASAHIIGHSMGASIAQELVLDFPVKVTRLILVSGTCGGSASVSMDPETLARLTDKSGTVQEVTSRMFSLLFPASWLAHHDPARYCPEIDETPGDGIVARQADAFFSWTGSLSRLGEIHSPTLVITGTGDVVVPAVNSRIIRERIPASQLAELPGAGHGLMYQCPDRFCDCVLEFLHP
jgi:pimeloyl-ACP methyl ester carboxylesterase